MPNSLYIEPSSGVSGDMFLSALCGLCDAYEEIQSLPQKLNLEDGRIEINELNKNGIVCKHVKIVDTGHHHHDHDSDHGHHHHHAHRHLSDIIAIIDAGDIPESAKQIAKQIFTIIGESESRIHNIPLEKIHFHEVSGVDSILDIAGCALLIDRLEISESYSDPVCVGYGKVNTQHGLLPVPAPATADILQGIPCYKGDEPGERSTPTGAAIVKYLNPTFQHPSRPTSRIAYGPGQKDFKEANVLRLSLLDTPTEAEQRIWVIETNIDDMPAEYLGDAFQEGLMTAGCLDFHFTPIQMKKARPGLKLSALAPESQRAAICDYILEHSTAIGVRFYPVERKTLERRKTEIATSFGTIPAKETIKPSGAKHLKFEYDALKEIALRENLPLHELKRRLDSERPSS